MLIDLSHTIENGLVTYKGLPAPIICDFLSREASKAHYAEGTTFQIGKIEMVANTGTYIDAPFHRHANGKDVSELPLDVIAGLEGVVIRARNAGRALDASLFEGIDVRGKAVLVETRWSRHWNTESYYEGHPFLTEAAATLLKDRGARIVGIDSYNIDDTADLRRPAHTILLGADIPIVEHMCNLDALPDDGFRFYAVPPKIKSMGTFPIRAFAQLGRDSTG
ncbi:MAG TPA: cyclase family protein [Candidatus Krumholzibacteria bacterium]|nr:cyclase family protein [Candidatus Krumholzibacteria bacterium]